MSETPEKWNERQRKLEEFRRQVRERNRGDRTQEGLAGHLGRFIMGTCSVADAGLNFSGTYAVTPGQVQVTDSVGVNWRVAEVR